MSAHQPVIAVLLRCEHQEFQQEQATAARAAGKREGVSVDVDYADNSPFAQIQQILSLAKRPPELRPGAIVVELVGDTEGYKTAARAAVSGGMAWVEVSGLATSIPLLRYEFPERFVMSVTTKEEDIGRIHAAQCRALLPPDASILYIEGPSLQPEVKARRHGLEEGLRRTQITIGRTLAGDWTEESAERAMTTFLNRASGQRFMPALVCAQNDEMAVGARRVAVARDRAWARLPYLGCDGIPSGGQKYVKERLLAATVMKPITAGVAVVQAAHGMLRGTRPRDIALAPESVPALDAVAAGQRWER
ncbi:MAG: substrate-binding domain-containing protein [Polyangiaceae bacterium]|nr:substrate-binding domain-containing protein [Polyangiaceae bacterium]